MPANTTTSCATRSCIDGPIISFEPVSHHIDGLRERSRGDRDWHIEGYALGSSDGSLPINVMVSDQFSSFLEPDHGRVKDYAGLNVPCHTETVTVRTLDVVLPVLQERIGFDRPYLKIDTQGFDIEVLRGAADSLPAVKALQTEASVIGIYKGMPQYMDIIRYLERARLRHHRPLSGEPRQLAPAGRVRLRHDQPGLAGAPA